MRPRVEDLPLPIVVEEPAPEDLRTDDPLGLGHEIGAKYRIWTGTVDTVLGFTKNGCVVVRGENGKIRRHLTPASYSKRVS